MERLIHELQVHQIELEIQNEELVESRAEVEALLARSTELYDFAPVGYLTLTRNSAITQANLAAASLLGLERATLMGRRLRPFLAVTDWDAFDAFLERVYTTHVRQTCEFSLVREGQRPLIVQVNASLSADEQDCRAVMQDVTEHKRLEEETKSRDRQLVVADRRKDEFLAMLGHELLNPLAPIRNALRLIRLGEPEPRPEIREAYDIIERQVENLVRLVDDLLDVGRITSGKIRLQKECIDAAVIVARAIEGARPLIDARRHTLVVNLPEVPVRVEADPLRLAQVLWNLLNNAAKYTPDGGKITLTVERGAEVMVRIRDTGVGIAPEMLPRVFELFSQVDHTLDRAEGGLGIGLTLVRRLTEMHGGTVTATSDGKGQGCEFVVSLPVLADESALAEPGEPTAPERRDAPSSGRRVLVVDDNRDSAESLALVLRFFGNDVRTSHEGNLALELAVAYRPEVVLMDIGLPGMDGLEVCRRLRNREGEIRPLIVAMTGYAPKRPASMRTW